MEKIKNFNDFLNEKNDWRDKDKLAETYNYPKFEIKIIKAESDQSWYKDLIGEIFVVIDDKREEKWKIVPDALLDQEYPSYDKLEIGPVYYINKEDAELIKNL